MKYYVEIPSKGYFLSEEGIKKVEERYGARYMGYWAIHTRQDPMWGPSWGETPVDVFYQPNPDTSKGHTNYFGIFQRRGETLICNAESAFSEAIYGIVLKSGEVMVSRYRHDCVMKEGHMIDGGRDYIRTGASGRGVIVKVVDGEFVFNDQETGNE